MSSDQAVHEPWAAMRDESLTMNERHRPNARMHIGTNSGRALCGPFFLDESLVFGLDEVPEWRRCQRGPCRKQWPAMTTQLDRSTR